MWLYIYPFKCLFTCSRATVEIAGRVEHIHIIILLTVSRWLWRVDVFRCGGEQQVEYSGCWGCDHRNKLALTIDMLCGCNIVVCAVGAHQRACPLALCVLCVLCCTVWWCYANTDTRTLIIQPLTLHNCSQLIQHTPPPTAQPQKNPQQQPQPLNRCSNCLGYRWLSWFHMPSIMQSVITQRISKVEFRRGGVISFICTMLTCAMCDTFSVILWHKQSSNYTMFCYGYLALFELITATPSLLIFSGN